ncbi:hypothetical protein BCR33DRAFT_716743 [Rhizoclosmatium globosum]|uniref:Uncharacterized protein n=1 Tax=Rhizoclosmatium globosum TaxID=329046 RepID=A0A1Y2CCL7_9FUNG|nr:hypothetical protein BCR33DRAFT_716743 [Rhizoclosmatium globosum]|eukprot:ORY44789.1 hypothetical protein BCR33DRAFT_716743 [Rhizoclosmatium globosum]
MAFNHLPRQPRLIHQHGIASSSPVFLRPSMSAAQPAPSSPPLQHRLRQSHLTQLHLPSEGGVERVRLTLSNSTLKEESEEESLPTQPAPSERVSRSRTSKSMRKSASSMSSKTLESTKRIIKTRKRKSKKIFSHKKQPRTVPARRRSTRISYDSNLLPSKLRQPQTDKENERSEVMALDDTSTLYHQTSDLMIASSPPPSLHGANGSPTLHAIKRQSTNIFKRANRLPRAFLAASIPTISSSSFFPPTQDTSNNRSQYSNGSKSTTTPSLCGDASTPERSIGWSRSSSLMISTTGNVSNQSFCGNEVKVVTSLDVENGVVDATPGTRKILKAFSNCGGSRKDSQGMKRNDSWMLDEGDEEEENPFLLA